MPWTGALHWCGISLRPYLRRRGREFLRVGELPRSPWPWCGGLSIHWRWRRSCKSLLRMFLTFIYNGNSKGSIVHATEIALSRDCTPVPRDLEIAHWCRTISRLRKPCARLARNFGILEIAQIPRLRETYILPNNYCVCSKQTWNLHSLNSHNQSQSYILQSHHWNFQEWS